MDFQKGSDQHGLVLEIHKSCVVNDALIGIIGSLYPKVLGIYRIHNNQDSQIRGSTMNFLLINYLLENPNYKEVVLNNNKKLYLYIKGSFQIGFQNFLINRNKQTFRNNCKQIPTICKKSFLGKYYACLYFIVSSTPSFFAFFYIVLRRIKRLFKHDK